MKTSKVSYVQETRDYQTGELTQQYREVRLPKEPDFIKLYLDNLIMLSDMSKWNSDILHQLLKRMNYQNKIVISAHEKRNIAKDLGITNVRSIDNALGALVKHQIIFREGTGTYVANPYLFGKGDWSNIHKIRLSVEFSPTGKVLKAEIEKEEPELETV